MAGHTFWIGHLKLSLVTAAVTLSPARTQSNKVSFNILNKETGNRVESRYVDSVTHRPVADKNQVRGFPTGENEHVVLESTRTIDIEQFVPWLPEPPWRPARCGSPLLQRRAPNMAHKEGSL